MESRVCRRPIDAANSRWAEWSWRGAPKLAEDGLMRGRVVSAPKIPTITQEQGVTVVSLGADYENLNESGLEALNGMLLKTAAEADPPLLVLDLSNLRFFGSGFIEALFRAWSVLNARPGGRMSLCGLTAYCREVVEITHLDQLWRVFDSRDEAVRFVREG
jgi:anti-sigma B factor antagonist